jgi:aminoglycoside phosphotransferase (APT) family kinase protein
LMRRASLNDSQWISEILAFHDLEQPETIQRADIGRNNPIFMVDDRWVVRFDGLADADSSPAFRERFKSEVAIAALLRERGFPAPVVEAYEPTPAHVPRPYMLMQMLPGRPIVRVWQDLSVEQRHHLASQAGRMLAALHDIPIDGFGWPLNAPEFAFPTWTEWVADAFKRYSSDALALEVITQDVIDSIADRLERAQSAFDAVSRPWFVHRDFHFENLLTDGERITGLLDFEWSLGGDTSLDFATTGEWVTQCAGAVEPLRAAYLAARPMTDGHDQKVQAYALLRVLDDAGDVRYAAHAVDALRSMLNR